MEAIDSDECFATLEELRAEGKIGHYGVALGPAIGWREEGLAAIRARDIASVQTVYNLLEQDPGRDFMAAAAEQGVGVMARVPTSSGLLDDNLTPETTFGPATTVATVHGSGWWRASRRSTGFGSCAAPRPAAPWRRLRSASSSRSRR